MGGLVGGTLGRYEIVALVGRGGMGEVFRARDTELGRDVAVKVLPAETAEDGGRLERFKREARAVAQLSHPNILAIHDFGSENGVSYSVTELLEGSDLRDRLAGHALPVSKVLRIGRAVAEGLAAAHGKGIVHRDIKPANIFITKTGQVKILDFGIAGLRSGVGDGEVDTGSPTKTLTEAGQLIGTTAYMSPEQVAGQPADARSDIFSLGCVLYEMLTGKRAFDGKNPNETMVAVVSKDPTPISELRSDVPAALELVVKRCLEKEPDERFESARDVSFALEVLSDDRVASGAVQKLRSPRLMRNLRAAALGAAVVIAVGVGWKVIEWWLPTAPELPAEKHLAVMGFDAGGDDPALLESAAGLERVVADGLTVVERDSRGEFWVVPLDEAERLGARTESDYRRLFAANAVLRGHLRRSGDRLQLDLDVVDPASGASMRRLSIEDSVSNVGSFQEEPVLRIADLLGIEVSEETRELLDAMATTRPEGFSATIRALGMVHGDLEEGDLDRAIELLTQATTIDPLFAFGRVQLGRLYLRKHELTAEPEWLDRAQAQAGIVTEGGRPSEGGYLLLADIHRARADLAEAVVALEAATRAAPKSAEAHMALARGYEDLGRPEDSEREARRAIFLRPGYWPGHDLLAKLYLKMGDYVASANEFNEVIACAPELTKGYNNLGGVLSFLGRNGEAQEMFERSVAVEPNRAALSNLGTLYFDQGRLADAAAMFERAVELDDSRYLTWGNLGYAYRFGPAPEKADDCFRRAVELAKDVLASHPDDLWTMTELAGYYAMLDQTEHGLELLDRVVNLHTVEPQLMAQIAETFEDLGDRERALGWVARAFAMGIEPSRFEIRPTLRELVADERYQELVKESFDQS